MSAVPKKKLCWNCEGNVAKGIDNCPYCGVYLHAEEIEENSAWNPTYRPEPEDDEIPSPLYQIKPEIDDNQDIKDDDASVAIDKHSLSTAWKQLIVQLQRDIFPILFLMMGSILFLFGVVLLLFSQNGTFTLQWQEKDGLYFLLFAVPLIGLGWIYFQRLESED